MWLYINIYVTRNQQSYHMDIFNTENSQKVLKIANFDSNSKYMHFECYECNLPTYMMVWSIFNDVLAFQIHICRIVSQNQVKTAKYYKKIAIFLSNDLSFFSILVVFVYFCGISVLYIYQRDLYHVVTHSYIT